MCRARDGGEAVGEGERDDARVVRKSTPQPRPRGARTKGRRRRAPSCAVAGDRVSRKRGGGIFVARNQSQSGFVDLIKFPERACRPTHRDTPLGQMLPPP